MSIGQARLRPWQQWNMCCGFGETGFVALDMFAPRFWRGKSLVSFRRDGWNLSTSQRLVDELITILTKMAAMVWPSDSVRFLAVLCHAVPMNSVLDGFGCRHFHPQISAVLLQLAILPHVFSFVCHVHSCSMFLIRSLPPSGFTDSGGGFARLRREPPAAPAAARLSGAQSDLHYTGAVKTPVLGG